MKKTFLIILLLLPLSCVSLVNESSLSTTRHSGTQVNIDEAERELKAYLDVLYPSTRDGVQRIIESRYSSGGTSRTRSGETESPEVHIFNFSDSLGYAIISGDRRVGPIICITEKGHLEPDSVIDNPGMAMYLANMDTYYRIKTGLPVFDEAGHEVRLEIPESRYEEPDTSDYHIEITYEYGPWGIASSVGTILPCQWGQGTPSGDCFNANCFTSNGQQAWAGCGPIAVGQIMYFWGKDYNGNGVSLDWDDMHTVYNRYSGTTAGRGQVSQLIQILGLPANMNAQYGSVTDSLGTFTSFNLIPQTFLNFGYTSGGTIYDYTFDTVYNNVYDGPVLGRGYEYRTIHRKYFLGILVNTWETFSGGHDWVFDQAQIWRRTVDEFHDGYYDHSFTQDDYIVHINWGWDGCDDGYFGAYRLDINNPRTRNETTETFGVEDYFHYNLKVITGISAY